MLDFEVINLSDTHVWLNTCNVEVRWTFWICKHSLLCHRFWCVCVSYMNPFTAALSSIFTMAIFPLSWYNWGAVTNVRWHRAVCCLHLSNMWLTSPVWCDSGCYERCLWPDLRGGFVEADTCSSGTVWLAWLSDGSPFKGMPCIHSQLKEILPSPAALTCPFDLRTVD